MTTKQKLIDMARIYKNKNQEFMMLKEERKSIEEEMDRLQNRLSVIHSEMDRIQYNDYAHKLLIDVALNLDDESED